MILKTLRLKAFSSFREAQEVDFSRYRGRIFVVTGDTGAGKTSVFDGVVYALYGKFSGSVRQAATARNLSAAPDESGYAELVFEVDGVEYTVHRELRDSSKSPKKDDCRITWDSPDGCIIGVRPVTSKVEELLGFNCETFCRISVLAQGEFAKFLFMDSKEKSEILRNVFGTDAYERFEQLTKERMDRFSRERDRISSGYGGIVQQLSPVIEGDEMKYIDRWQDLDRLLTQKHKDDSEKLEAAKQDKAAMEKSAALAAEAVTQAKSLNERFDELDRHLAKKAELEQRSGEMEQMTKRLLLSESAERVRPAAELCSACRAQAETAAAAQSEAEEAHRRSVTVLTEARQELGKKAALSQERDLLLRMQPAATSLAGLFEERSRSEEQAAAHSKALEQAEKTLSENKALLDKAAEKLLSQSKAAEAAAALAAQIPVLEKEMQAVKAATEDCGTLLRETEKQEKCAQALEKCRAELEKTSVQLRSESEKCAVLSAAYYANLAGILAADLSCGEPCPVCGSTEHPHPAVLSENTPSKEEKERLEQRVEELSEEKSKAASRLSAAEVQLEAANAAAELSAGRVFGETLPQDADFAALARQRSSELDARHTELVQRLSEAEEAGRRLEEINAEKAQLSAETERLTEECGRLDRTISEQRSAISAAKASAEAFDSQISEMLCRIELPEGQRIPDSAESALDFAQKCGARAEEIRLMIPLLESRLSEAERSEAAKRSAAEKCAEAVRAAADRLAQTEQALSAAAAEQGFSSAEEAAAAMLDSSEKAAMTDTLERYKSGLAEIRGICDSLSASLADKQRADIPQLEQAARTASAELDRLTEDIGARRTAMEARLNIAKQLADLSEAYEVVNVQYLLHDKLNRLISGKKENGAATGVKMSFERYVQGYLFDEVLRRANIRLRELSGGRYCLCRREINSHANRTSGLDLDIKDMSLGGNKLRDVSTLSGGESFLASFALAIALSDYTMEENGGRCTDVLFVDEGFSNLDENTFAEAMEAISKVSTPSRIVGFVSHIKAIRDHFTEEIYVKKGACGSSIVQGRILLQTSEH